jgi:hypothetical protein
VTHVLKLHIIRVYNEECPVPEKIVMTETVTISTRYTGLGGFICMKAKADVSIVCGDGSSGIE